MAGYLTTEQLVTILNSQSKEISDQQQEHEKPLRKKSKTSTHKIILKIAYFALLALAIIHVVYITIPLVLPNQAVNVLGQQFILAVPNDQEIDGDLYARVVSARPFRADEIAVGDQILIYGKFGTDIYWVEDVVEIYDNQTLDATFDGVIRNRYDFDDIQKVLVQESDLFGSSLYVASSVRGYVTLLLIYIVVFGSVYYFVIRGKKIKRKPLSN